MSRHHLVYQITNLINNKIYIGIHVTNNLDDGYMGSGRRIREAIDKYGIENFKKEILFDFDNPEEMILKESQLVDRKFIARKDVYNISVGGLGYCSIDNVTVRDTYGNCFNVHKTDERYLSGELKPVAFGFVTVRGKNGNCFSVQKSDPRLLSGELVSASKGKLNVKDEFGKIFKVSVDDERYLTGKLIPLNRGKFAVKDKYGNIFSIEVNDPRFISGELIALWKGRTHQEQSKKQIGEKNAIHQKGVGNSQFGTCWIYNCELKQNKKIKKGDILPEGWTLGRKFKFENENHAIKKHDNEIYTIDGLYFNKHRRQNILKIFSIDLESDFQTKYNILKDLIYKLYIIDQNSTNEIAKMFNTNNETIRNYLNFFNIKRRSLVESIKIATQKK